MNKIKWYDLKPPFTYYYIKPDYDPLGLRHVTFEQHTGKAIPLHSWTGP